MKRLILYLIFAIILLVFITILSLTAFCVNKPWSSRPISVYADTKLTDTEISQLKESIHSWNSTSYGTFFVYKGTIPTVALYSTSNIIGVTKVNFNVDNIVNDSLARTVSTIYNKNTRHSIITLNTNYKFTNNSTSKGYYNLKSVLMHELFHTLGFSDKDHILDTNSIFYEGYTSNTAFSYKDLDLIGTLY